MKIPLTIIILSILTIALIFYYIDHQNTAIELLENDIYVIHYFKKYVENTMIFNNYLLDRELLVDMSNSKD